MAGAKIPLTFRIFKDDQLVREETLTQPVIKVGKLSSSHLRLDDDSVSRMHAVIEVSGPGDVSIIDLGSTKGTYVNGQKVNKAKLQTGDAIVVGDTRIELSIGGAGEADEDEPTRVQSSPQDGPPLMAPPAAQAPKPPPTTEAPVPHVPAPTAQQAPAASIAQPSTAAPLPGGRATSAAYPAAPMPAAPTVPIVPAAHAQPPAAPPPPGAQPPVGMATPFGGGASMVQAGAFAGDSVDDLGGARAVEVAAMLGDSVVGVKHVMNPRGGKVTPVTYALFGIGAVLLLIAAFAFSRGVSNADFNKTAKQTWLEEKRPLYEFRPNRISLAYDWMAFGGSAIGLICVVAAALRLRDEREEPWFRIGTDPEVEFATDAAPAGSFPLVAPLGDDFVFNFTQGMEGELTVDGQSIPLASLSGQGRARPSSTAPGAMELPIPPKARIRVQAGKNTFLVSSVPQPRRQPVPLFAALETQFLAFLAASAMVVLGFLMLILTIPPDPRSLTGGLDANDGRLTRVQSKAQEDPKVEEEELSDSDSNEESGGTGTAMALDEGKMGKEDSERAEGQFQMKKEQEQEQLAKEQQVDQARNAGFLGTLKATQGGAFASLTGAGDISSGFDDANIYGGLLGDEAGEMQGGFGFGRSGFGPGGGGTGWGTIGTGRYGTIGHGSGTGSGYGSGSGRGGMRGRRSAVPAVRIGTATATGDLDKAIIRRYIRRKLPQIKYCYEKQLLVNANLEGTVTTSFQISPTGAVIGASANGVDGTVSSCVASVIQSIVFPKPKGGGLVQVRYPFNFNPAGG